MSRPRTIWMVTFWTAALWLFALAAPAAATTGTPSPGSAGFAALQEKARENRVCFRCHAMPSMGYLDAETGRLRDLSVTPEAFYASGHGKLACEQCHLGDFDLWPHDLEVGTRTLSCIACHREQNRPEFRKYRLEQLQRQMEKSVHFRREVGKFDCSSCHDPHAFQAGNPLERTAHRIQRANAPCLSCHAVQLAPEGGERRTPEALHAAHNWLPKRQLHWRSVRCVDCHTPPLATMIHAVEPASRAQRRCEECHTRDSFLLNKLYRHRMVLERRQAGFWNSVVMNDAYIIGMTRNGWLDGLSLLLVAGTVAGVGGHGLLRWYFHRRRNRHGQ